MFVSRILPSFMAVAIALSPAHATVTFLEAGANSSSAVVIGKGVPPTQNGPVQGSTTYTPDAQYTSVGVFHYGNSFETVDTRGAGAVHVISQNKVDFFVSAKAVSAAVPFTDPASGIVHGGAFYDFSLDTDSIISLSYLASDPNFTGSSILGRLFNLTPSGGAGTYFLNGQLSGSGLQSFTLPAGDYSFEASASAFPGLFDHIRPFQNNTDLQSAEVSLSISSPALPPLSSAVPEPKTWAMMLVGFAAIGAMARKRRSGWVAEWQVADASPNKADINHRCRVAELWQIQS